MDSRPHVAEAMRAAVFLWVAVTALVDTPWRFAALPSGLRFGVPGPGVPDLSPEVVAAGTLVLVVCCGMAAFGNRLAVIAAVPLAWWILGVPQMYGKVNHYHHLLWLAVLFAVMPAVSALRWTWPTMGVVYLFPGIAKLRHAGELIDGGMYDIIRVQQWTVRWDPPIPVNSTIAQLAAVGTILFEVGFVFAAFTRWRRQAAMVGLAFHIAVFAVMRIAFWPAAVVLLVLCFDRSEPRLRWHPVAAVVLAGAILAGIGNQHGWPFAPYPPFDRAPGERQVFEVRDAEGERVDWLGWIPDARRNGLGRAILREPSQLQDRCGVVAPAGGTCWAVTVTATPDGVREVQQQLVAEV